MRFLVLYAHPVASSFVATLHQHVVQTLRVIGHEVDDCDLYAERFQPILTHDERVVYEDADVNQESVKEHVQRLRQCDGILFVFPTWFYGMPAILKGYFDRVWLPGVAFEIVAGRTKPLLQHIKHFGVVTTYGSPWWLNMLVLGNPNRKVFMRGIRHLVAPAARTLWLAQYGMDVADEAQRQRFLATVQRRLERL